MLAVKIIGAGSIGNHLAHGFRKNKCKVTLCDIDDNALRRSRESIYPDRYGKWDPAITLACPKDMTEKSDIVVIGTPPDTHVPIATDVLHTNPPKVLHIEKPLCPPSMQALNALRNDKTLSDSLIVVGFNHLLTAHTRYADEVIKSGFIGSLNTITSVFRENWGGIFSAHPWLEGPWESYLGFGHRGGGAMCEHSHAINIWQHFARQLDAGRIAKVSCMMDIVENEKVSYDSIAQTNVVTDKGYIGSISQDVVTTPAKKYVCIQGTKGSLEWHVNYEENCDAVILYDSKLKECELKKFPKKRPDDFDGEIKHLIALAKNEEKNDIISLPHGIETQLVIMAAYEAHSTGQVTEVNYELDKEEILFMPEGIAGGKDEKN